MGQNLKIQSNAIIIYIPIFFHFLFLPTIRPLKHFCVISSSSTLRGLLFPNAHSWVSNNFFRSLFVWLLPVTHSFPIRCLRYLAHSFVYFLDFFYRSSFSLPFQPPADCLIVCVQKSLSSWPHSIAAPAGTVGPTSTRFHTDTNRVPPKRMPLQILYFFLYLCR